MSAKRELAERLEQKLGELEGGRTLLPLKRALTKDLAKLNMATLQGLLDLSSMLKKKVEIVERFDRAHGYGDDMREIGDALWGERAP